MNKKLLIHLCILAVLVLFTYLTWSRANTAADKAAKKAEEAAEYDDYASANISDESDRTAEVMMKTAIPFGITVIYAGFITIAYLLPGAVNKLSEEVYGSTAEVEDDPLHDARVAVAQGDYPTAIRHYREVWKEKPDDRLPLVEIAKIQREDLESPALAVDTLKEALESRDWPENDAAFFMFRIAEIYEDDLKKHDGAVSILKQVIDELPETRHAANATHKLRELGEV